MQEHLEVIGSTLKITLPSELDHPVSDAVRKEADRIMEHTYIRTIIFDFKNTRFMDSSGIGLIMGRYRALGMRGKGLKAVHVNARMEKLMHLSGIHKFIEIIRDEDVSEEGGEGNGTHQ